MKKILRKLPTVQDAQFQLDLSKFADFSKAGIYFVTIHRYVADIRLNPYESEELTTKPVKIHIIKAKASQQKE